MSAGSVILIEGLLNANCDRSAISCMRLTQELLMALPVSCRSPAHCIEYVHLIQWQHERGAEEFDSDEEEHMRWVYERAVIRGKQFGIQAILLIPCSSLFTGSKNVADLLACFAAQHSLAVHGLHL